MINTVEEIINKFTVGGNPQVGRVYSPNGAAPTLNTMQGGGCEPKIIVKACLTPDRLNKHQYGRWFKQDGTHVAIRKLTPLECWRLQGFTDEQFRKARSAGVSDSQLYKQAGNAVTVPVVEAIGKKMKEIENVV